MLNYMKSEGFRIVKNKNLRIMFGICLVLLAALVIVLYYCKSQPGFPYANTRFALANVYSSMTLILLLTLVIATIIDDGEYKNHTIKHSVAFGISRRTIYGGKFIMMVVSATVIYLCMTGFLAVLSYGLLDHSHAGELITLTKISIASYTTLIAGLAMAFFFLMLIENPAIAATWSILLLFALPAIANLLGRRFYVIKVLSNFMPSNCIDSASKLVESNGGNTNAVIKATVVGFLWASIFLIFGLLQFRKKEIK